VPTFSADYLVRLAGATGFRPDTLEKVLRLGRVLDHVGRHPFLGERLALKGGTALNLFFGAKAPRLTVDLDFNYVRPVEHDEMLREKGEIERALGLVAEADGYRLQWSAREHAGRKTYLHYRNALGTPERIEVDVNYLPELVVGDEPELLERVRRHPMLLWKAENGRKRRRPGRGGGWTVIARRRGR
jgi:predicted nucleotidyltransferase component of viral defense system